MAFIVSHSTANALEFNVYPSPDQYLWLQQCYETNKMLSEEKTADLYHQNHFIDEWYMTITSVYEFKFDRLILSTIT